MWWSLGPGRYCVQAILAGLGKSVVGQRKRLGRPHLGDLLLDAAIDRPAPGPVTMTGVTGAAVLVPERQPLDGHTAAAVGAGDLVRRNAVRPDDLSQEKRRVCLPFRKHRELHDEVVVSVGDPDPDRDRFVVDAHVRLRLTEGHTHHNAVDVARGNPVCTRGDPADIAYGYCGGRELQPPLEHGDESCEPFLGRILQKSSLECSTVIATACKNTVPRVPRFVYTTSAW